jgi:hypothetical protein
MALQEMPVHRALQALKVYKVVPEMMEILVTQYVYVSTIFACM